MAIIGIALFLAILIQLILFIPAYGYKTDKLTDLSYALTFVLLALLLFIFNTYSTGKLILLVMITLWALRLGSYLLRRIQHMGRDARFDGIREDFFRFLGFWLFQGVTVWIIMIPAALYFSLPSPNFNFLTVLGLIIWLKGLLIEAIADQQKFVFRSNPKNKNTWLATGLWKYSRHPNYYGEILCWLGVYVYAASALTGFPILIALISPVFIALLLLYYTGVPGLERSADERFGHDRRYRAYKKNTSILILWPPKNEKITFKKTYKTTTMSAQDFLTSLQKKINKTSASISSKTKKELNKDKNKLRKAIAKRKKELSLIKKKKLLQSKPAKNKTTKSITKTKTKKSPAKKRASRKSASKKKKVTKKTTAKKKR